MRRVLIIGAGPAGLTAAYELLKKSNKYEIIILEETNQIGGISKTVNYKGNRMDIGGHRFFSKAPEVVSFWNEFLPMQGKKSYDDLKLKRKAVLTKNGPDPEETDKVMLKRKRVSRIFFKNKFFDYPITLRLETIKNMGFITTIIVGLSYLKSRIIKRNENSLEDFYINRFGKKLYSLFFENYTTNLWGRHPSEISPEWGAQRVKGLSIGAIIKDIFGKTFKVKNRKVETSLIEEFSYPKLGPGQLYELIADEIIKKGGQIIKNAKVVNIHKNHKNRLDGITYIQNGNEVKLKGDYIISSMPLKDLVVGMNDIPKNILNIAKNLPYRDYITVGILTNKLDLKNNTDIKTFGNIIPDNWIYIHDKNVKMSRMQVYNNWSPYLVKDIKNTIWVGLEYFCDENDEFWSKSDNEIVNMGIEEMIRLKMIDNKEDVLDAHVERIKKAYPAYFDSYNEIDKVKEYLNNISNLYCVGRNGQHRYNNMDHSMMTSFETVKNILNNIDTKDNIWNVNTEKEYHEDK